MIQSRRLTLVMIRVLAIMFVACGIVLFAISAHLQEWKHVLGGVAAVVYGGWLAWNPKRHLPDSYWESPPPA
jgi:hypothetical protein